MIYLEYICILFLSMLQINLVFHGSLRSSEAVAVKKEGQYKGVRCVLVHLVVHVFLHSFSDCPPTCPPNHPPFFLIFVI